MKNFYKAKRRAIVDMICLTFVVLFTYSAMSKLAEFDTFKAQIGKSPTLNSYVNLIAIATPTFELVICVLLAFQRTKAIALYLSLTIMVSFTAYIISILNFSEFIPCSCGGILESMTWNQHLGFNCLFLGIAIFAILLDVADNKDLVQEGGAENLS
jgi:hypothetical protein